MQFLSDIFRTIPPPVWFGASVSLVIATAGLTISTVFSSDVELEVANSKLVLSREIAKTQKLHSDSGLALELAIDSLNRSRQNNQELKQQIKELKTVPCAAKNNKIQEIEQTIEKVTEPETKEKIKKIESIKGEIESNSESLEKLAEELIEEPLEEKNE